MIKKLKITVEGKTYEVEVEEIGGAQISTTVPAPKTAAPASPAAPKAEPKPAAQQPAKEAQAAPGEGEIVPAPIPGKVLSIKVKPGDTVGAGQVILILEAMKMENEITAPVDGQIKDILVAEGQAVNSGDAMLVIG
ncbi:biotin/lipoyl-containing protein [Desulfitibacter alkalitolerans]|uniref:biotin/lipoyl-containing protein n=1 Tax=Desulfitibacter alkalitolerans TaxID=264641 RepID=UPI0004898564|nr:biotin/lipoyl-containing protein [Desulfitibacter alkalitolerans]